MKNGHVLLVASNRLFRPREKCGPAVCWSATSRRCRHGGEHSKTIVCFASDLISVFSAGRKYETKSRSDELIVGVGLNPRNRVLQEFTSRQ